MHSGQKGKKVVSVPIPHISIDIGSTLILTVKLLERIDFSFVKTV